MTSGLVGHYDFVALVCHADDVESCSRYADERVGTVVYDSALGVIYLNGGAGCRVGNPDVPVMGREADC